MIKIRILILAIFWISLATAAVAQSTNNRIIGDIVGSVFINRYYESPKGTNVAGVLKVIESSGSIKNESNRPPLIGFMAGLFLKYPDKTDSFIPKDASPELQSIILNGLRLAGRKNDLKRYGEQWGFDAEKIAAAMKSPKLPDMKAVTPTDFDYNWGAGFATGESRFPRKVFDAYALTAENPKVDVQDIVKLVQALNSGANANNNPAAIRNVTDKYSGQNRTDLFYAVTALRFLNSNAKEHRFVSAMMQKLEKEKAKSKAIAGWRSINGR